MVATQSTTASVTKRTGLSVELFATNLHNPSHMEWTPQGRLLVSEHTAGRVMDITDGGDMRDAEPYAYGLQGPSAILPINDHLLVAETWGGRVSDISAGGDASNGKRFATELSTPYSLSAIRREGADIRERAFRTVQGTSYGDHRWRNSNRFLAVRDRCSCAARKTGQDPARVLA